MKDATKMYDATSATTQGAGRISDVGGCWEFTYDINQTPEVSSERKRVYVGVFCQRGGLSVKARALVYDDKEIAAFGRECANLNLLSSMGVGPRLLAITQGNLEGGRVAHPMIIEQDAGQSLSAVIERARLTGRATEDAVLAFPGTPERALQNAKIMYDIYVQVLNAHLAGIYHRDLRCENVCVRRFGPEPQDIRATVIDFDLGASPWEGRPSGRAPLYETLFREIPSMLGYGLGAENPFAPNPLELDMAYLAALQYHVERGSLSLNGRIHIARELTEFVAYAREHIGFFGYDARWFPPRVRELDQLLDIDGLAQLLGLVRVDERTFSSAQLLARAKTFCKPYLDGEDIQMCNKSPEARLASMVDKIALAVFQTYKEQRRAQGKPIEHERMEDQPLDLQKSNYAQAEHIPVKVRVLGYELVPADECDPELAVSGLTDEQVEVLACLEHDRFVQERIAAGWTLDRGATKSDPARKRSPYLVPYDELEYDIQEYDRDAARQMVPLLKMAGLTMARHR